MQTIHNTTRRLFAACGLVATLTVPTAMAASPTKPYGDPNICTAPASWFTADPGIPTEVPNNGNDFCDFYQFTWQSFLSLMWPVSGNTDPTNNNAMVRNFADTTQYPLFEFNPDGSPANSCDNKITGSILKTALQKDGSFVHGEAGGGDVIFDQNGNIAYYDMRFSRNMCTDADKIKNATNFPGGTTELKTAWRVLDISDKNIGNYLIWHKPPGLPKPKENEKEKVLALIGFHFAIATPNHPEFIWATFEHNSNAPDCNKPAQTNGWSFTSTQCATALQTGDNTAMSKCMNQAKPNDTLTGVPTEICRVYPNGTDPSDLKAGENVADITSMNTSVKNQVTGAMAVLKNYFNVGSIWVSDISKDSTLVTEVNGKTQGDISNQRGSLRLANTVAETTFQWVDTNAETNGGFASNCFGCHSYEGTADIKNKNTTSGLLSHIFDDIVVGMGKCVDVQAGPIFDQTDAAAKCNAKQSPQGACPNLGLAWNGQWTTTQAGQMSVCGCCAAK
ncbi:mannan-binding lectin [Pseudoalteromonas fenneropenaei]|uniref:Mannan-binding lectin n=1 Tax=Pseudoalteromonas fenneropenaei TaxID=1737459 RepID=A0ABV7CHV1_9GAMM